MVTLYTKLIPYMSDQSKGGRGLEIYFISIYSIVSK